VSLTGLATWWSCTSHSRLHRGHRARDMEEMRGLALLPAFLENRAHRCSWQGGRGETFSPVYRSIDRRAGPTRSA